MGGGGGVGGGAADWGAMGPLVTSGKIGTHVCIGVLEGD